MQVQVQVLDPQVQVQVQVLSSQVQVQVQGLDHQVQVQVLCSQVQVQVQVLDPQVQVQVQVLSSQVQVQVQVLDPHVQVQVQVLDPQVQVQVQVLGPQVQVQVQVLQICTRVVLEYKYKYQVLHLCAMDLGVYVKSSSYRPNMAGDGSLYPVPLLLTEMLSVQFLRPLIDVLPSQSLGLATTEETKPNTTKANIHPQHKITQRKHTQKLKSGLVASYDLRPGNAANPIQQLPGPTRDDRNARQWVVCDTLSTVGGL